MKPHFLTAVILVCGPIHVSHFNSTLMLYGCIGERLALEVALTYWSCISIKISSFGSKVPLCFLHTEKWQLRWIGKAQGVSPPLPLWLRAWALYEFWKLEFNVTIQFGETHRLKCWKRKPCNTGKELHLVQAKWKSFIKSLYLSSEYAWVYRITNSTPWQGAKCIFWITYLKFCSV